MPSNALGRQMQAAFAAHRSATINTKALRYAGWVLSLFLIVTVRDRVDQMDVEAWIKTAACLAVLPMLASWARAAMQRQRERAERRISTLLQSPRGLVELTRVQQSPRFRHLALSDSLRREIIQAAMSREAELEDRRRKKQKPSWEREGETVSA